jgi:hypothetical protein
MQKNLVRSLSTCNNHGQEVVTGGVLPKTEQEQLVRNKCRLQKSPLNETTTTEQEDGNPQKNNESSKT